MQLTGTHINYYFICSRKLWFHSRYIQCEQESDLVLQGKILHESSFNSSKKEFQFDSIKIDWLDLKNNIIHEVKKSPNVEDAHLWQLKYYLYYFKKNNIGNFSGEINYPKLKIRKTIELTEADISYLEEIILKINNIINSEIAPTTIDKRKICKNCSYYELCFV